MRGESAVERGKRLALFVMLIMGTVLHAISVAHIYLPALAKAGAFFMGILN